MATRFYFPTASYAWFLSWQGGPFTSLTWNVNAPTTSTHWFLLNTFKRPNSPGAIATAWPETSASAVNVFVGRYISNQLLPQTISGTVKGIFRCLESASGLMDAQIGIRAIGETGTVRGTLIAQQASALASEFSSTTLTNRKFPLAWTGSGATLTSVTAQAGDRLAVEIGFRATNVTATSMSGTIEIADDASLPDLAEDEVSTTAGACWLEFSQTLQFIKSTTRRGSATLGMTRFGTQPYGMAVSQNVSSTGSQAVLTGGSTQSIPQEPTPPAGAAGSMLTHYYKKRARDSGSPTAVYVSWTSTSSTSSTSSYPSAPPFGGPLVEETIVETWAV